MKWSVYEGSWSRCWISCLLWTGRFGLAHSSASGGGGLPVWVTPSNSGPMKIEGSSSSGSKAQMPHQNTQACRIPMQRLIAPGDFDLLLWKPSLISPVFTS